MSNKKVKELSKVYDKLIKLTGETLERIDYSSLSGIQHKTFYEFIERFNISLHSISVLLPFYFQNDKTKFPIAQLLRTSIIDCITVHYLIKKNTNEDSFNHEINRLSKPVFKEQKELYETIAQKGCDDYKDYIELVKKVFAEFYDNKGKVNHNFKDLSVRDMYNELVGNQQKDIFYDLYKLFQYFSNYVHYSKITKRILEAPDYQDFVRILISTNYIKYTVFKLFLQLKVSDKEQEFKKIKKMILEMIIIYANKKYISQNR